jgi:membrane complex biogenesis BtpA family protein
MLHLLPLPGAPLFVSRSAVRERLLADAGALVEGGVHGLMMENFGDSPFFPDNVPGSVVAEMTALAGLVKLRWPSVPLGINVLRNDGLAAMAVAAAVGAEFVRINILTGARVTDQGVIQGRAAEVLRLRRSLGVEGVAIWADVDVKHSAALAVRDIKDEVDDVVHRGHASALIASGAGTGKPTDPGKVAEIARAAGDVPVLIGAGASVESLAALSAHAGGFIVGTALKVDGVPDGAVDPARVRGFMAAWRAVES